MAKNLADNGVECHFGEGVDHFEGAGGKVTTLVTNKGSYPVDMICVCIGFRPNNALFADGQLDLFTNGAVLVDHHQKTSRDDVYAVGDCSTIFNNSLGGDPGYIALASNAVRSGIVAGHNICGTEIENPGVQGASGICIFDLKMVSCGLTENAAKRFGVDVLTTSVTDTQKAGFIEHDNPDATIKIVYDKKTRAILGAQIASTYDMSGTIHMFSLAVQKGVTIDELKLLDIFFLPHFNAPYNYITVAALKAE
jgi:NADPH-dependent 2,4-dienoyl-CoA reductase/sulfur reductase-like enzyme